MKPRACICGVCGQKHFVEMTNEEYQDVMRLSKWSISAVMLPSMACDGRYPQEKRALAKGRLPLPKEIEDAFY